MIFHFIGGARATTARGASLTIIVFFFQAEDGIRDVAVTGVQTCALPISLERVAERLERTVVGSAQNAATAAVVKQGVDGFLKHALFVAHDDVRRAQLQDRKSVV